jgi:hypothetical protein
MIQRHDRAARRPVTGPWPAPDPRPGAGSPGPGRAPDAF